MNKNDWNESRLERDARITETLAATGGPVTAPELTRQLLSLTPNELIPRSQLARVTQSLRVMEVEGIVKREKHGNTVDWQLARKSTMNVKQVIVIRRDLKMRRGKEIAQGAHASLAWLARRLNFGILGKNEHNLVSGRFSDAERAWLTGSFRKITCQVPGEAEILALKEAADKLGTEAHVITDAGHTEFGGVPTITAIAIGPDLSERIDLVTGELALY